MGTRIHKRLKQFIGIMLFVLLAVINCEAAETESEILKLEIDWDKWSGLEREYDGTADIIFEIPIKDSEMITFEGVKKEEVYLSADVIIITGSVNSADAGSYNKLTIEDVRIEGNEDIYDVSEIEKRKNEEITLKQGTIHITQAVIKDVKISAVELYYRTDAIDVAQTKNKIKFPERETNIKEESVRTDALKEELIQLMGNAVVIPEENICQFTNLKVKEEGNSKIYYVTNDNIEFQFDYANNKIDENMEENRIFGKMEAEYGFAYHYESEIIKECNMADHMVLTQDIGASDSDNRENENRRIVSNQSWCNANAFHAYIKEDSGYGKAYNHVVFRKMDTNNFNEIKNCQISGHNNLQETTEQLKIDVSKGEENIYEMIFCYQDAEGKKYYPTVAAFIRIIEEEKVKEGNNYPTVVEDNTHNTYSVINVFLDTSEAVVDFKELGGMKYVENGELLKKYPEDERIAFQIINKGFEVKEIQYEMCKVNKTYGDKIPVKNIQREEDFQVVNVNSENEYKISLPEEDGVYVVNVRVVNEDEMVAEYISNGIVVDTTPPEVTADFYSEGMNEEISTYTADAVTVFFQIREEDLQNVDVEVETRSATGKEIEGIQQINEQIEQLKDDLLKDNKGSLTFTEDSNYRIKLKATDKQGLTKEEMWYCFTIDSQAPEMGTIHITGTSQEQNFDKTWDAFTENITFKIFNRNAISVTFEGSDAMSPVAIYYYIADEEKTMEELNLLDDENWKLYSNGSSVEIAANRQVVIYEKVEDAAGNKSYFNSDGIITDNRKPEIAVSESSNPNENGFYNGNVELFVSVEDRTKLQEDTSSGLQHVSYRIEKNDVVIQSKTIYESGETELKEVENPSGHVKEDFQIKIQEDFNNSDDVILYVTAVDNAGNKKVHKKLLKIDNVKPEITVTYDEDVINGKYCNQKRTATVTIKERNLDTKDVKLSVSSKKNSKVKMGKWTPGSNAGKSDNGTYECKVTFLEDDDYKFEVSCVD